MVDSERQFYGELGRSLRRFRTERGLTQEAVGDLVGLTRTSITNIESGNQPVSAWLLCQFARHLKCNLEELTPQVSEVVPANDSIPPDVPPLTAEVLRRLVGSDRP
ncbi:MAG: helix-turn-helix transcriptional regulator [Ilumatobacter fluminis]|uniref:helix-turn-helix transcriptional regulator n=1 Tax=Ilumatobacter fluminis TaxID=467091 RepID=UPI0032EFC4FB